MAPGDDSPPAAQTRRTTSSLPGRAGPAARCVTQNVDDLHVRAGTRSLVRIHGSIWELSCWEHVRKGATPWRDESVLFASLPPRCPHCGGHGASRRRLVWRVAAQARICARRFDATACDVFLAVGTSAVVYPAAGLVHEARGRGAFTAEINLEATPASATVDLAIHGAAEVVLPLCRQPDECVPSDW